MRSCAKLNLKEKNMFEGIKKLLRQPELKGPGSLRKRNSIVMSPVFGGVFYLMAFADW